MTRYGRMRPSPLLLFVLLVSCGGTSEEEETGLDLSGRTFVSESLVGRELVPGTEIRLSFRTSELSADAGCNSLFGDYHFDDNVLLVPRMGMTAIGCDPPLHDQDEWLAGFLQSRPTAELVEPRLTLSTQVEVLTLLDREVASPDRELVGTHWVGNGIGKGGAVSFGPGSDLLTVAFGADGRVEAFSGCQHGRGAFVAGAATVSFTDLVYDGAPCTDPALEPLSDSFVFVLDGSAVSFEIEERRLFIEREGTTLYFLAEE